MLSLDVNTVFALALVELLTDAESSVGLPEARHRSCRQEAVAACVPLVWLSILREAMPACPQGAVPLQLLPEGHQQHRAHQVRGLPGLRPVRGVL